MRLASLTTAVVIGALACGGKGGDQNQNQQSAPPAPAAGDAGAAGGAASGPVVEVKMTGNGSTRAAYEPSSLKIAPGTTVRFVNVSGGPHNIAFWQDSIPSGAAAALNANMKNTIDNLSGPFLTSPNETYDVSFANAPKGTYKGYCTPHVTLGMKIGITVE
jgi:plastocyanin